ncbi:MAG: hypothetical protein KF699_03180 [Phycisphaeraceae bacterium]|nr:hypothetical protein [Phycisphaeraceae bacterium]
MNQDLAKAIEDLLRRIPDKWQRVDTDQFSVTEEQAILRLVGAGLVERRNTIRLDMAGQNEGFEATIAVTGEAGLLQAIEPALAESWSRWSGAIEDWRRRTGAASRPFRVTKIGGDEWRLTEHGLLARADLSVPLDPKLSREHAAVIASRERVIDFVMKAGALEDRPPVHGTGQLVSFRSVSAEATAPPSSPPTTHVNLTNAADIAAAFRDAIMPMVEAIVNGSARERSGGSSAKASQADTMTWQEAMSLAEAHVTKHGGFFPGRNELARIVGCSPATMTKAIENSTKLKARRKEAEKAKKAREVGSSETHGETRAEARAAQEAVDARIDAGEPLDAYHSGDEDTPGDRDEMIAKLAAEQRAERLREDRQHKVAKKRPER